MTTIYSKSINMKTNFIQKQLKFVFILFSIFTFSICSFAQEDEDSDTTKHEKVQQLKIAYITSELNLTSSEAEKFWPIYNEMNSKLKFSKKEKKKTIQELNEKSELLKDEEIKKKLNLIFDSEIAEVNITKEYNFKIAAIIGYKKSAKLLNLEQEFRRELLKRLKENNRQGNNQRQGQGQHSIKR